MQRRNRMMKTMLKKSRRLFAALRRNRKGGVTVCIAVLAAVAAIAALQVVPLTSGETARRAVSGDVSAASAISAMRPAMGGTAAGSVSSAASSVASGNAFTAGSRADTSSAAVKQPSAASLPSSATATPSAASSGKTSAAAAAGGGSSAASRASSSSKQSAAVSSTSTAQSGGKTAAAPSSKVSTAAVASATSAASAASLQAATDSTLAAMESRVITLVNAQRAQNGLGALTVNTKLTNMARVKSQDMIDNNYFSHESPTYGSPFEMMQAFGITYRAAGENIAYGQQDADAVMDAWMNSAGHRANILSADYTQIGVGAARGANGRIYWTQEFIG